MLTDHYSYERGESPPQPIAKEKPMMTHKRLEQFLTQIVDQSANTDSAAGLFANDDNETFTLWPAHGVPIKLFLEDDGARLTIYADLGPVAEERQAAVFKYLLELNFAWRALHIRLAVSEDDVLVATQCWTEQLDAEELDGVLSALDQVTTALLPLIADDENLETAGNSAPAVSEESRHELEASGAIFV